MRKERFRHRRQKTGAIPGMEKLLRLSAAGNTQDAYQYAELTDLTDVLFQAIEE